MAQPLPDHRSDPALSKQHRDQIAMQAKKYPSLYARLVSPVNAGLSYGRFGISPASHGSVMNNLQQVNEGNMSQSTAHFNEAQTFGRDAQQSYRDGNYRAAGMEGLGAVINTFGGIGTSFAHGIQTEEFASGKMPPGLSPWD